MTQGVIEVFAPAERFQGIRPIQIYVMRALYGLMFFVLGYEVLSHIIAHPTPWSEEEAMAWSVWGAFALIALLGMLKPIEMIPILLLEIIYKSIWLTLAALPQIQAGTFVGSGLEETTFAFALIIVPILAMPWGYVYRTYIKFLPETRLPSPDKAQ